MVSVRESQQNQKNHNLSIEVSIFLRLLDEHPYI